MKETLFTALQATQLLALGPTLFIVAFLLLTIKLRKNTFVPVIYFLSLACSFFVPLLPLVHTLNEPADLYLDAFVLFCESLTPALSFLLVIQVLQDQNPKPTFWLILALPIIGGSSFIYGTLMLEEVCLLNAYCIPTNNLKSLYSIFSASLIFLFLIAYFNRTNPTLHRSTRRDRHIYWFIIALISLNLVLMSFDLLQIAEYFTVKETLLLSTLTRIGFVYLVLTSVFRLYDTHIEVDVDRIPTIMAAAPKSQLTVKDTPIIARILTAMHDQQLYREMRCTREGIAKSIGIHDATLSRIINQHFRRNFNEFINAFRIEEAKSRLRKESTPITVIAFDVGFNSIASFNRVFKESTGVSPSDYRHSTHTIPSKMPMTVEDFTFAQ
jgi:AraC-like DNA-binding protein